MIDKMIDRKRRVMAAMKGRPESDDSSDERVVSDQAFFNQAGIKVVKKPLASGQKGKQH